MKIPEYSILRMRDECFICTEAIPGERSSERFRRLYIPTAKGPNAYKANDAITELFKNRGNVKVEVNEDTGQVKVSIGKHSVHLKIPTLSEELKEFIQP